MKFTSTFRNQKGFSLVELMIVVGIIGILATLALPRFKQFQAKAKMGEAKNILSHIYTLEQTYSLDNNTFRTVEVLGAGLGSINAGNACAPAANGGAQAIGFRIDPCQGNSPLPRYQYSVPTASASAFVAQALTGNMATNRICPGNPTHYFAINEANVIFGAQAGAAPAAAPANATEPSVGTVCAN